MKINKYRIKKKFKEPKFLIKFIIVSLAVLTFLVLFVFTNIRFLGVKSANEGARRYQSRSCLAFYPNTENGRQKAKDMCKEAPNNSMFDYALVPYGDYYLVEYGNGTNYYINKVTSEEIKIDSISEEGIKIISDYLRYEMKKDEIDEAYTLEFIEDTKPSNININECEYKVNGKYLDVYFPKYDYVTHVPLMYMQKEANINLGYDDELYVKPRYISSRRKIVAFTFDDGPNGEVSKKIIDYLYDYDAVGTFFVQGINLYSSNVDLIKDSISKGNQYGSHTQDHADLNKLSSNEIYNEIIGPVNDLLNGYHANSKYDFDAIGYEMKIYRPPYGNHNDYVDSVAPLIAITWDCDSNDWKYRDAQLDAGEVLNFESMKTLDGKIVLFHDLYNETAQAMEILIPKLISKGYQFVTVDDILESKEISHDSTFYPW